MPPTTITLITACFNSADVIRTALESVLRQTWPAVEYLIVDGASSDGTLEIIREYEPKFAGRMRWISEPDHGMYDAINKGIRLATGELVGILNADDVLSQDDSLEIIAKAFIPWKASPARQRSRDEKPSASREYATDSAVAEIDAIYGDIRFVRNRQAVTLNELRQADSVRFYSSRYFRPWLARFGYMPAHPSFYCRKALFERLGGYRLDYRIAADHELLIRFLVKEHIRCCYIPRMLVIMRMGGISTRSLKSTLILNRENIRACRENNVYTNWIMQLGKYLFKVPFLFLK